jgi:predicted nucleic acid-binding protein
MTTRLVVDASVAVKWSAEEPDTALAMRLLRSRAELLATDLIYAQVLNALWAKWRRGLVQSADISIVPRSIVGSFAGIVATASLILRASDLAMALGHPVHDCLYLAAGLAQDCPVVSADGRLLGRVVKSPYRDRVMPLADWQD